MGVAGLDAHQRALLDKLFAKYKKEVRPICEEDAPIEVKVGIAVRQIMELDEPSQILTVNVWVRLNWYDCQMTWNATEYGGISKLILPYKKVWTPDITLYDNAGDELIGLKDYRPTFTSDGAASYNFPTVIKSLCPVDVTYFPFDGQTCALRFGSWAYSGHQLNITIGDKAADISDYKVNTEWELLSVPAARHEKFYSCCPEPYPDVTFYISMRRKPFFYIVNLLFPCILISAVGLLGFLLPPDAGEKVALEITMLLSLSVFMLLVAQSLPPTSDNFPCLGIYFCVAMLLVALSTALTVIVLNVHFRGQHGDPVPHWIRKIFLGTLSELLCVRKEPAVYPVKIKDVYSHVHRDHFNTLKQKEMVSLESQDTGVLDYHHLLPLKHVLEEQLSVLKEINSRYSDKQAAGVIDEEWRKVAVVVDRLLLVLFFIATVASTVGILLSCILH
ncbi:neuronal acetylcholine receptor subunit alpha-10-like [Haliotis rubra]|uniref:neuronal acetylcholine receptor subunit alpha-10-like n=1 Tax=Haliotis rubra TaxID=36100 RepID=UPI001EE563F0|nr:neuronal acetylcholine receptor subunit alpha-10-like [Haliotis rubra]